MITPRTQDEYLGLVNQAIFEIEDVLMCAEDEGDPENQEFSDILPDYEQLLRDILRSYTPMCSRADRPLARARTCHSCRW
ncbi:MAG: hypothetical protein ACYC9J_07080 [Sulfuricaulis sp.]